MPFGSAQGTPFANTEPTRTSSAAEKRRAGTIRLISPFGQILEERFFEELPKGAVTFDLAALPGGLYFVDLKVEGRRRLVRTVVFTKR